MKSSLAAIYLALLLFVALPLPSSAEDAFSGNDFNAAMNSLVVASSIPDREAAVQKLATIKNEKVLTTLQCLLDGCLYKIRGSEKLVLGKPQDDGLSLNDAANGEDLGIKPSSELQKITLNNSLRVLLRKTLGRLQLNSTDTNTRISAIKAMAKAPDDESLMLLRDRMAVEPDAAVQDQIKLVLALAQLNGSSKSTRIEAIDLLKNHPTQDVVNRLNALVEKDADGNFSGNRQRCQE